jgi:hypothetical protein
MYVLVDSVALLLNLTVVVGSYKCARNIFVE